MEKQDHIVNNKQYTLIRKNDGSIITVRDLQLEVLTIMDEIHRVCVKNKIKYALIAGSALGICNYKGFIPWDDDIDICIEKKDWKKFIKALEKDLDKNFYFQCFENDKNYNVLIPSMKIRKKNTFIKEKNFLLKNRCKSGDGIFVDVVIYDNVSENKFSDEINRTYIKLLTPIMVLLDNLRIPTTHLKKLVLKIANKYGDNNKDSKLISQTIAIPWEKFLHEPIFEKKDVLPFKLYEFEGRKFYSYNNIEKIMKQWYGDNCLKKWNGKYWEETLPEEKRKPKHCVDLNLNGEKKESQSKKILLKRTILIGVILMAISLILFNQASFPLLGCGLMIIGISLLIYINKN